LKNYVLVTLSPAKAAAFAAVSSPKFWRGEPRGEGNNFKNNLNLGRLFFMRLHTINESALKTSFCHFERSEKSYILNKNNRFLVALLLAAKAVTFSATE